MRRFEMVMDLATGLALLESDYHCVYLQTFDVSRFPSSATFDVYRVVWNAHQAQTNRAAVFEYRCLSCLDFGVYRYLSCSLSVLFVSFGGHLACPIVVLEIDLEIVVDVYVPRYNP